MFLELFKWWYGSGWLDAWQRVGRSINKAQMAFSLPVLVRSLFSPWKQITSAPGQTLNQKFNAKIDNLVSRTIGFFVRLFTRLAAIVFISAKALFGVATALAWPMLPIAAIY